jgi:hypothetical protein
MLEKLFARLRLRRQDDVVQHLAAQAAAPTLPAATLAAGGLPILAGPMTPPPLPADAWAESESGIVIGDSGIIILGPDSEPRTPGASTRPAAVSALAQPADPRPKLTPGELDWDDVLARARARAEEAAGSERAPSSDKGRAQVRKGSGK